MTHPSQPLLVADLLLIIAIGLMLGFLIQTWPAPPPERPEAVQVPLRAAVGLWGQPQPEVFSL